MGLKVFVSLFSLLYQKKVFEKNSIFLFHFKSCKENISQKEIELNFL